MLYTIIAFPPTPRPKDERSPSQNSFSSQILETTPKLRMQIRILGSAAGGGLPQWNCSCPNCVAVRAGSADIEPRTQSSVAVSGDGQTWFLLNVSPDIRQQIIDFPQLIDERKGNRGTWIGGCVLTDAEIDHTTGLLLLREGCSFDIFSTAVVRRWLNRYLPLEPLLSRFAERAWRELPMGRSVELCEPSGHSSELQVRAFELDQHLPRFVEDETETTGAVVGLVIEDARTGGKLVYAPCIGSISDSLVEAVENADVVLVDGTFWSDDEMMRLGGVDRTARDMGHLPVGDPQGSLRWLAELPARHRAYVHINNTNPMLDRSRPQYKTVTDRGISVGADGDCFTL